MGSCPCSSHIKSEQSPRSNKTKKRLPRSNLSCSNRQLPILPARLQASTFGVYVLNYCVRNGNRWSHIAIITGYTVLCMYHALRCRVTDSTCTHKTIQKQ